MSRADAATVRATARALIVLIAAAPAAVRAQPRGDGDDPPPRDVSDTPTADEPAGPWRLASALDSPPWLDFGLTHRARYEHIFQQFRPGAPGDDLGLSFRTTVRGALRADGVALAVELIDSRLYFADANTPLNTTLIDPVELLRAYVQIEVADVGLPGATLTARAGRITMDLGSRRLVARNRYRNTINAFTGVDLEWTSPERDVARVIAVLPVTRRPTDRAALADNAIALDREHLGTILFGAFIASRPLVGGVEIEGYLLGLHERDTADGPTADRRLVTPGVRLLRPPSPGGLDLEIEAAAQLGTSRASRDPSDTTDLEHLAFLAHASAGYTVDVDWRPRVVVLWDYASGDASPTDGSQGRFDTLYGARRFEYGPTGLWGAIARGNLHSPGLRVEVTPHAMFDAFASYRPVWLAQAADAWTGSGVRDPTGESGDFVGHQVELRLRFLLRGNVTLAAGFAHIFRGPLATDAPNANPGDDPTYLYASAAFEL